MKSYKVIILRSSQIVQLSLFLATMALIAIQIIMVIACVFNIDLGIQHKPELSFGIYG